MSETIQKQSYIFHIKKGDIPIFPNQNHISNQRVINQNLLITSDGNLKLNGSSDNNSKNLNKKIDYTNFLKKKNECFRLYGSADQIYYNEFENLDKNNNETNLISNDLNNKFCLTTNQQNFFKDSTLDDFLNLRYTLNYRNKMVDKLKLIPNRDIIYDSQSEIANISSNMKITPKKIENNKKRKKPKNLLKTFKNNTTSIQKKLIYQKYGKGLKNSKEIKFIKKNIKLKNNFNLSKKTELKNPLIKKNISEVYNLKMKSNFVVNKENNKYRKTNDIVHKISNSINNSNNNTINKSHRKPKNIITKSNKNILEKKIYDYNKYLTEKKLSTQNLFKKKYYSFKINTNKTEEKKSHLYCKKIKDSNIKDNNTRSNSNDNNIILYNKKQNSVLNNNRSKSHPKTESHQKIHKKENYIQVAIKKKFNSINNENQIFNMLKKLKINKHLDNKIKNYSNTIKNTIINCYNNKPKNNICCKQKEIDNISKIINKKKNDSKINISSNLNATPTIKFKQNLLLPYYFKETIPSNKKQSKKVTESSRAKNRYFSSLYQKNNDKIKFNNTFLNVNIRNKILGQ